MLLLIRVELPQHADRALHQLDGNRRWLVRAILSGPMNGASWLQSAAIEIIRCVVKMLRGSRAEPTAGVTVRRWANVCEPTCILREPERWHLQASSNNRAPH